MWDRRVLAGQTATAHGASHGPFRDGETFDQQLGDVTRKEVGNHRWRKRVQRAIAAYDAMLIFDHLYVGSGNATHLHEEDLGPKATIVPNVAGVLGGIKLWEQNWDLHESAGPDAQGPVAGG
jgi:polyphosphate glucokinase